MRLITLISFVFFLYFSSQQSCSIQNCAQCNSDNASCTQCKEGYTLLNGECPCNDRNCLICSSSFYGGCTQCKANFFLDKSTGTCQSKIEHCLYYTDNGVYCSFYNAVKVTKEPIQPICISTHGDLKAEKFISTIFGPTCDSIDCLGDCFELPEMEVGDWFKFETSGK